ncbi:hypothetical protein [Serratia ficaria]|uniref:DUF805 domain-containing protein n=1 Tax=Serratia ficaria TaxID=61651 RepID=A0A240C754_SERFI|nr:hypothetical protein [Serratia ficaria]REF43722.1 hypothetical protein C7332_1992 [Serratia ficaria]CAI0698372.1 Uncharacterised protein [Serratia ficaria]CAI0719705.1 Uncharacterised protein [Serratia ficaria]CAI0728791.1 Uncharacterised protein [Serratia ficaria]CAI1962534.1 Uncharacterised protein [Serratia ficaria]
MDCILDSLGHIAKSVFTRRITRRNYVFSTIVFAAGIALLSLLSPYLDKNHFCNHAHGDSAKFHAVLLYLLCVMAWSLCWLGLIVRFVAHTAFRLNDVALPGWPLALYLCGVINNYCPGAMPRWLPLISLIGVLCALLLPPRLLARRAKGGAD